MQEVCWKAMPLALFMLTFFAVWSLRATVFTSLDESLSSPLARALYSNSLKLVLWVLPAFAYARWVRRRPPAKYLGLSVWPSARLWLTCLGGTATFLALVAAFDWGIVGKRLSGQRLLSLSLIVLVLQYFLSPLLEEVLFRGLLMNDLQHLLSITWAALLTSALFVGIHLPYWLSHGGPSQTTLANSIGVFLFSVLACWLFAKSSSLWPPTVAHIGNNLLASLLSTAGP